MQRNAAPCSSRHVRGPSSCGAVLHTPSRMHVTPAGESLHSALLFAVEQVTTYVERSEEVVVASSGGASQRCVRGEHPPTQRVAGGRRWGRRPAAQPAILVNLYVAIV